jgi:hypothetical protein
MIWLIVAIVAIGLLAYLFMSRASGWRRFRRAPMTGRWGRRV